MDLKETEEIIYNLKEEIWRAIQKLDSDSIRNLRIEMRERSIYDYGEHFTFGVIDQELFDFYDLDEDKTEPNPVDYRDLCIEDLLYIYEKLCEEL